VAAWRWISLLGTDVPEGAQGDLMKRAPDVGG
jgi:hypothetical protein